MIYNFKAKRINSLQQKLLEQQLRDALRARKAAKIKAPHRNLDGSYKPAQWANPSLRQKLAAEQGLDPQEALLPPGATYQDDDPVRRALELYRQRREFAEGRAEIDQESEIATPQAEPEVEQVTQPVPRPIPRRVRKVNGVTLNPDEILGPDGQPTKVPTGGLINGRPTAESLQDIQNANAAQEVESPFTTVRKRRKKIGEDWTTQVAKLNRPASGLRFGRV
jgi:hypothetical protein